MANADDELKSSLSFEWQWNRGPLNSDGANSQILGNQIY